MKQIFRFAAVAMLTAMSSSTALAGNWVVPAPAGQPLAVGDTVYIWNVGQKAWINKGESWGTQAVVNASSGLKYVVKQTMEENTGAEVLTEARYYLWSDCGKNNHYLKRIADGKTGTDNKACFVDGANTSGNQLQWEIADLGGNKYSIKRPELFQDGTSTDASLTWEYVEGEFLGVNLTHDRLWDGKSWAEAGYTEQPATYALWFDVQAGDNATWLFVSPKDYDAYALKFALKDALEKAEAQGVDDITSEEAVFNNASATEEEINAAINSLNNKIATLVDPTNPVDMTSNIVNPEITDGINGWSTTTGAQNNATATNVTNDPARNSEGAFSGNFYENWNPNAFTGKMYQVVKNLPNGVYKVGLSAFINKYDLNNATTQSQYVYFNDLKIPLTTGDARAYSAYIDITTGELEIGLAQDVAISEWMGLDNASLVYYGSGLASYQYITTSYAEIFDNELAEAIYSPQYKDAVDKDIAAAQSATTKEEALAIYATAQQHVAELKANVAAYVALQALNAKFEDWVYQQGLDLEAEWDECMSMLDNPTATTEDILAFIADVEAKADEAAKNAAKPGDDVTHFITNPWFNEGTVQDESATQKQSFNGWTIEGTTPGAGGTTDTRLAEVYQGDFKVYQDLKGIQKGAYQLEIQAFMRPGSAETAYANWEAGNKETPAYIFAGDNKVMVKSICDFMIEGTEAPTASVDWSNVGGTYWIPNSMKTAYEAMAMDPANYNNVVTVLCIDGNMRIGIGANDPAATGSRWMLFHDFKLTYLGYDPTVVSPVLQSVVDQADLTAGRLMAAEEKTALNEALTTAKAAIEANNGDAMMAAYRALIEANTAAAASADEYDKISAAIEELTTAYYEYMETASTEAIATADKLMNETPAALADGSIKTEDCGAKVTEIKLAINGLKLTEGSDDKPADFTWAITNPDFTDGTSGWETVNNGANPGVADNVMEGYNGNFDVHQDIYNLPEGTYLVKCQGFYRYGWLDGAAKAWEADTTVIGAKLYANLDSVEMKDIILIDEIATSASGSNWKEYIDSVSVEGVKTTYYAPNMRDAANERFQQTAYPNQVYTYVGADGFLRIGFNNTKHVDGDWTTASYFELFYLGKDSQHAQETGVENINNSVITGSRYYSIDGRQMKSLNKGLNIIKTTNADGKTTVRKVIVK